MAKGRKNPLRSFGGFVLILAGIAASLLCWQYLGGGTVPVTKVDVSGDPAFLQGFALTGMMSVGDSVQEFTLQDGDIVNRIGMGEQVPNKWRLKRLEGIVTFSACPTEEESRTADQTAVWRGKNGSNRYAYEAMGQDFLLMMRVFIQGQEINLPCQSLTAEEPVPMIGYADSENARDNHDYVPYEYNEQILKELGADACFMPYCIQDESYFLGWTAELLGIKPGLYRVEGLSWEQRDELPKTAMVNGTPVLSGATPYGEMQEIYAPEEMQKVLQVAALGEGIAVLWQTGENELRFDYIATDGALWDSRSLGKAEECEAQLMPRDAVNQMNLLLSWGDAKASLLSAAAQEKELAVWNELDLDRWTGTNGNTVSAAVMNEDNSAVLLLWEDRELDTVWEGSAPGWQTVGIPAQVTMEVYPFGETSPVYTGKLENTVQYTNWSDGGNYQIFYRTLPQDKGEMR